MKIQILKSAVFNLILASFLFTSCDQLNLVDQLSGEEITEYVDQSLYEIEERGNLGRFGCYELVFPVTLNFADETTLEVEDYEGLRAAIHDWKEANSGAEERPSLSFPLEVMTEDGELISIEDAEALQVLRQECKRDFFDGRRGGRGHRGHGDRCGKCFTIVFPISIAFPDGTSLEVADRRAMKEAIRTWRSDNPDAEGRSSIVFPIQVQLTADESVVDIADAEELAALRTSCRDEN